MLSGFSDIPESALWEKADLIEKGWSGEKKYRITANNGQVFLLRVSEKSKPEHMERKKTEFALLRQLEQWNLPVSRPIDWGAYSGGIYALYSWTEGTDAETAVPKLSPARQYALGLDAGQTLRAMHRIPASTGAEPWEERFNRKIDRNINLYHSCGIELDGAENMIAFINANRPALKGRPQTFQHGDYHVGNMLLSSEGRVKVIDFNRFDFGDPWEEFNRIPWCAQCSPLFASGMIDGYFKGTTVPEPFFRLTALYIASNKLSSVPWAVPFGEKEIRTMLEQGQTVMSWYRGFSRTVPEWYAPGGPADGEKSPRE